jgi:hypothetical protein
MNTKRALITGFMQYDSKFRPYEKCSSRRINGVLKQKFRIDKYNQTAGNNKPSVKSCRYL